MADLRERLKAYEDLDITPEQIREIDRLYREKCEELAKYKELGDIEELKKVKNKDKAVIPNIWGDGEYNGQLVYDMYDCPTCEKSYEIDSEQYDYCPNCGQKLDWRKI